MTNLLLYCAIIGCANVQPNKNILYPKMVNDSCKSEVVVAVIDSGIDFKHPALKNNLWYNKKEVQGNGIDDDGNGFVDDVIGWNFNNNSNDVTDTVGHGTHVSGTVTTKGTRKCPAVKLMSLVYYTKNSSSAGGVSKAIKYAIDNGAHIINMSGGGSQPHYEELKYIKEAKKRNILFVAAAGNDGGHNIPFYPAMYSIDNIISVASISQDSTLLPSSNYGSFVDIAAPGVIKSTYPAGKYKTLVGTSMACAYVSLTASLLLQKHGVGTSYRKIKDIILGAARPLKHPTRTTRRGYIRLPKP